MLTKDEILTIIQNELSLTSDTSGSLETSLAYYMGEPNGTEVDGRSQIVSTDVADTIEWIMPQIMKSFTQNNEIVIFDPVHEGDEHQAELESEYVYEVLMKQNDGFIILHQFVKDALMQRNGILKVYYSDVTERKLKNYTGINEQQLNQLLSDDGIELVEQTEYIDEKQMQRRDALIQQRLQQLQTQQLPPEQLQQQIQQLQQQAAKPIMLYDVKVQVERVNGRIYIDPIPPENFRVNSQHNSINLDSARFTAHIIEKTLSDVMQDYDIDLEAAKSLPTDSTNNSAYRFEFGDDSVFYGSSESEDPSQDLIQVSECFMQMDVEQTGLSKLMKITVAGTGTPTEILSIEEIDKMPWVATTTFLMSHKFEGLSITDRLKQLQDHKTALWRNIMDNMYLQNNQRNVVVESQVNLDDLLVSRPGGIIRAKRTDAIVPLATPQLGQDPYNMMEYLDKVRAGRTGVNPEGSASPENIGDRVGSQGVDRLMNAKEELVGLIIRVVAETGIKPLCIKIRDLLSQHIDAVEDFKFRGVWQQINPAEWLDRSGTTVRVGTGTGNQTAKLAALNHLMELQAQIMGDSRQALVDQSQIYTALDDYCKLSGLNGATRYFIDPNSPQGKKKNQELSQNSQKDKQEQQQIQQAMAQSQMDLAKAEQAKAQAQMVSAQAKAQADQAKNELQNQKQVFDGQINMLKQQLEEAKAIATNMGQSADLDFRKYQVDQSTALELTRIEADKQSEENQNFKENKDTVSES